MKRKVVSIIMCAVFATAAVGCGSSSGSGTSDSASSDSASAEETTTVVAESTEAAETETATGTTEATADENVSGALTIWEHSTSFEPSLEGVIEGFSAKYPNVDVEYDIKDSDQYYNLLNIAIQSGDAPDIYWTNGNATNNMSEFIKADAMMDLTDIVDTSSLPENCLQIGTVDGKLYSVPWSCIDTRAVYYNKDMFDENGWEIPKTWDEFETLLQTIKDAGVIPISFCPNDAWAILFAYEPVLSGFDSAYTEGLADYSVKATDQPARDCMNEMLDWADKGYFGDNYLGVADGDAMVLTFTNGEAAMCIAGSWDANTFTDNNPDLNLGAFQIPDKDGKTGMVGTNANGFSVYKDTKNLDAATAFIQYCATTEAQQAWVDGQGAVSGNPNVESGSEIAGEIADCDTVYTSWQSVLAHHAKEGENASTLFENDITKVFGGTMTTDQFFDEIADVMQ
jgi:raffinose/stachyose/melibiose transport system substrate-binding protein